MGRRTRDDQDVGSIRIRMSDTQREIVGLAAELDGAPYDGRARGAAVAPWALNMMLDRARKLARASRTASDEDVLEGLREIVG